MDIRIPKATEAARILRDALAEKGVTLKHSQAIEVVARLNGYRNSHVMRQDQRFARPLALTAQSSEKFTLEKESSLCDVTADHVCVRVERSVDGVTVTVLPSSSGVFFLRETAFRRLYYYGQAVVAKDAIRVEDPFCECQNCAWRGLESELEEIEDFAERVEPGEECPAGECPQCGALASLSDDQVSAAAYEEEEAEEDDDEDEEADGKGSQGTPSDSRYDRIPAEPRLVEVWHPDDSSGAPPDLRSVRYFSAHLADLAALTPARAEILGELALEFDCKQGGSEFLTLAELLNASIDQDGRFHLQDGRILRLISHVST